MKRALIVVDMQNDFVSGSLGSKMAEAIVDNVRKKINEYAGRGDMIVFTRDTHQEDYLDTQEGKNLPVEHCIAGTSGWEIYGGLAESCVAPVYIDKPSFGWNGWEKKLNDGFDELELVGLCTDICVVSNALIIKACFPEVKVTVDASCCAGVSEERHRAALLTMKACQVDVVNFN